jgi:glutaconate CoA-transferase subunit A
MKRDTLLTTVETIVNEIEHGDTIAIGGFLTSHKPMAIVREIVRREIRNLTIVAPPTSLETDLLIATNCADTVLAPYVGAEGIAAIAPWFRHRAESGDLTVKETDGGMVIAALEAAERNLPFMPWRGGIGTVVPDRNDDVVVFDDPINGEPLVAVPAVEPDVALLHLSRADKYGNVQAIGDTFADGLIARAAKKTFVQVEEIVSNDEIRRMPELTVASCGNVDNVVEAPWGSHPFSCEGHYIADTNHLESYVSAASSAISGEQVDWNAYLEDYIYRFSNHASYVDQLGTAHRTSLQEYGGDGQ